LPLIRHNVGKRKEATAKWIYLRSNINHGDKSMKLTENIRILQTEFGEYEGRQNLEGLGMSRKVILKLIK
jgi:hypothetical protein